MNPPLAHTPPDAGLCGQLACILEATARKAGNVHRGRDFADTHFLDFLCSAAAIGPILEGAVARPVGESILACIEATRRVCATNTNLGIVLLLAPLAAAPTRPSLREGVREVLAGLTVADARLAYRAIRLARPGGLGRAAAQDVAQEPTESLREVMSRAADRDLIARQYAEDFQDVFDVGVPILRREWREPAAWERAIQLTHLHLLATHPDSLIARKRGAAEAEEASRRAQAVLAAGFRHLAFAQFDFWLREHGNARNPGTSADLVTACLFVGLREGWIELPLSAARPASAG